jgi:hypothetical protein
LRQTARRTRARTPREHEQFASNQDEHEHEYYVSHHISEVGVPKKNEGSCRTLPLSLLIDNHYYIVYEFANKKLDLSLRQLQQINNNSS